MRDADVVLICVLVLVVLATLGAIINFARQMWTCRKCPDRDECFMRYTKFAASSETIDPRDVMPEPPADAA